ncbi:hypothetical protein CEXT_606881 [Caerostris extrusa]|uniref:Uncharacterized protein n=1 Tax=Caerostris extrusa TaxID=172846 RepID=A0AAV4RJ83_CAEEX|nr:hypothetical protein CEXT_606881 [Caerostris extrusa]
MNSNADLPNHYKHTIDFETHSFWSRGPVLNRNKGKNFVVFKAIKVNLKAIKQIQLLNDSAEENDQMKLPTEHLPMVVED